MAMIAMPMAVLAATRMVVVMTAVIEMIMRLIVTICVVTENRAVGVA